jgi:hypothetical protein
MEPREPLSTPARIVSRPGAPALLSAVTVVLLLGSYFAVVLWSPSGNLGGSRIEVPGYRQSGDLPDVRDARSVVTAPLISRKHFDGAKS